MPMRYAWRSVGIIALMNVGGAAYADERPRAEEPSQAVEQPSPAAALTSQLCRIDIKDEKKDPASPCGSAASSLRW
jgi:hypothetical protein